MPEVLPVQSARTSEASGTPRRGEILRPSQIFDPVARALDVLGDRWTLVLVRQLLNGPKGSALSVLEVLPNLLREDRARDAHVVFEVRLTGEGGGVWTVEVDDGICTVREDFAAGADVRYTASARDWCAVAIGVLDAKEAVKRGLLHKEGGPQAMDDFFFQVARPEGAPTD